METKRLKLAGVCLSLGSIIAVLTMLLHPAGGNMEHIFQIKQIQTASHIMALSCLPFIIYGFWIFSKYINGKCGFSMLGFTIALFGFIAVMIAGTINGLVLPQFVEIYHNSPLDKTVPMIIIDYGMIFNKSLAYIFIVAIACSITIWSIEIMSSSPLPKWLGYYGLLLTSIAAVGLIFNFAFTNITGLSIFVLGLVSWMVIVGYFMMRFPK